jgi:tetratricopeptide (TPR) repeat protein
MRLLQTEYLLKGVYLGLVLFAALALGTIPAGADADALAHQGLLRVNLATLAGLALALVVAAGLRFRDALRARGRLVAFFLFLLLESPTLVYLGILGGTVTGLVLLRDVLAGLDPVRRQALEGLFTPVLGGAAIAGLAFGLLRQVRDRLARLLLVLALAAGLVGMLLSWLGLVNLKLLGATRTYDLESTAPFAVQILLGIPFFYLLTFSGHEEESEVEIAVMSGLLGLGLGILLGDNKQLGSLAFLLPLLLYFVYTIRVLPGLRVLKHAFRGFSYTRVGRYRRALLAFRRALQLDPTNRLAREGFWEVHRSLDLDQLANDPQTLSLVDLDLCLDRAGSLLVSKPTPAQLAEARGLLGLVRKVDPGREPAAGYWSAVAHAHGGQVEEAARELAQLLDPAHFGAENPHRVSVLLPAWQMTLMLHDGLRQRVGWPQLAQPGRRMEAIHAVERHLASIPDDQAVISMKKLLYKDLTEAEYNAGSGDAGLAAPYVDHAYLQHLGLALINDDARWQRGGEYLRLAARGLPDLGPSLFVQIAQAQQRAGQIDEARHNYELAKRAGQGVGHKNLGEEQRQAYFSTVKYLADEALARGDVDAAVENYRLYSESERAGVETLRTLAGLYERRGDALAAARATDQALQYNAKDPDLLERKDRYYYSIAPEQLQARLEQYGPGFDLAYCLNKAKQVLDRYTDPEWLDVAHHLTRLALVVKPESLAAKVLLGRALLRYGERDQAVAALEEARGPQKPEGFASGEDEEAWYQASQLLGDLYLEMGRADLAVPCLNDFRKSSKSGAKTLFKLGQAFEALGDPRRAAKCYEQVTAYQGNPLVPDAEEALARVKGA